MSFKPFALGLAACLTLAADTILLPKCGYLDGPACSFSDAEAWNIQLFSEKSCDYGLKNVSGTCRMDTRSTHVPGWVEWAMHEQRWGINGDTPLNFVTTFGTHNSYSNYAEGFSNTIGVDQGLSITDQLNAGARYLRLDPVGYDEQIRVCHGTGDSSAAQVCGIPTYSPGRLFAYALKEVADWLSGHPDEFLWLDFNAGPTTNNDIVARLLDNYFGQSKIFTPLDGSAYSGWPSLNTMKKNSKQLAIFSYPQTGLSVAWQRDGGDLAASTVSTSTYTGCITPNGAQSPNLNAWVVSMIGDDRSGSMALDSTNNGGYVNAKETWQATYCGFSLITPDFLLSQDKSVAPVVTTPNQPDYGTDLRREATVWSFDSDDYGNRGPAIMKGNGRWSSDTATVSYPHACASTGWVWSGQPANRKPKWVLGTTGAWNQANPCPTGYQFDYPRNLEQNADLGAVTNGFKVWLNYQVSDAPLDVNPSYLQFSMRQNGGTPAGATFSIFAKPSTTVTIKSDGATWMSVPGSATTDSTGAAQVTVSITKAASNLAGGVYQSHLVVSSSAQGILEVKNVTVELDVKISSSITLTAIPATANENTPVALAVQVTGKSGTPVTGTAELRETVTDSSGITTVNTLQSQLLALDGSATFVVIPTPGVHQYEAAYLGSKWYFASETGNTQVKVNQFFTANPSSLTLSFNYQNPPSGQVASIQFNRQPNNQTTAIKTSCSSVSPCPWFKTQLAVPTPSTLTVGLTYASVASLPPGTYNASVTISDNIHVPLTVPITLDVKTSMTLSPATLEFVVSNQRVSKSAQVNIPAGSIPLTATVASGPSWITAFASLTAPGPVTVEVNPVGVKVGKYSAKVTVSSSLIQQITLAVEVTVVQPSVITTSPAGLAILVDNVTYTTPASFSWLSGELHTVSAPATITSFGTLDTFQSWSDGKPATHQVAPPVNITATYQTSYSLIVSSTAGGTVQVSPSPNASGYYNAGTVVTVTAKPASGYTFTGWAGNLSGTANPQQLTINQPEAVRANFAGIVAPSVVLPSRYR